MKLVRENIAKRIYSEDPSTITKPCNQDEYDLFLKLKLSEELDELKQSKYTDISEYADVLEVLHTLMNVSGISWEQVLEEKRRKANIEGSFSSGFIYKNNLK